MSLWRFLPNLANLKDEADSILVDLWFGAFEVPVDDIRSFTWDEMHPPLPPLPLDPFFPTWVWGLISSASSAVVMLIPLYCCLLEADWYYTLHFGFFWVASQEILQETEQKKSYYFLGPGLISATSMNMFQFFQVTFCQWTAGYFRRLSNTRRKYRPPAGVDPSFMEKVVAQSDVRVVRRFVAREAGAQLLRDADWDHRRFPSSITFTISLRDLGRCWYLKWRTTCGKKRDAPNIVLPIVDFKMFSAVVPQKCRRFLPFCIYNLGYLETWRMDDMATGCSWIPHVERWRSRRCQTYAKGETFSMI